MHLSFCGVRPNLASLPLLVLAVVSPLPLSAQPHSPAPLSSEEKKAVIEAVSDELVRSYVYLETAERIAAYLRRQLETGAYGSISDEKVLASTLTSELRHIGDDKHLEVVVHNPEPSPAPFNDRNAVLEELRLRNFDFASVASLPGNVRYLELNSFPPPEMAGETAAAAMRFLAGADAIIIDLRRNRGGTGDMVGFISTYFFEERTALTRTFRRVENQTTEDRTLPFVPGPRIPQADLFILTSKATFSAAEAFAFGLQQIKRATIVGESTRGGANAGRYRAATDRFRVFVPNAHATSAATGKTWDKIGIKPDLDVPASSALDAAHLEAISRLVKKASDPNRKRELEWMADGTRAKMKPSSDSQSGAEQMTGRYGPYLITAQARDLFLTREENPSWPLVKVAPDTYLRITPSSVLRLTFRGNGPTREITFEYPDGRKEEFRREAGSP